MRGLWIIAMLVMVLAEGLAQTTPAQRKLSAPEQTLFDAANRERGARRMAPLKWNPALATAARGHAQKMRGRLREL